MRRNEQVSMTMAASARLNWAGTILKQAAEWFLTIGALPHHNTWRVGKSRQQKITSSAQQKRRCILAPANSPGSAECSSRRQLLVGAASSAGWQLRLGEQVKQTTFMDSPTSEKLLRRVSDVALSDSCSQNSTLSAR